MLGGETAHMAHDGWEPESRTMWDRVYQEECAWLSQYLRRCVPAEAVPDLSQEIWLTFWMVRNRYRETGRRRAFLRRLADRRVADWHRITHSMRDPLLPDVDTPDADFTGQLLRGQGVQSGSLLWHRLVDDWSLQALAAYFDVPVGTVKSRLARQSRDLRRRLDTWYEAAGRGDSPCLHFRAEVLGATPCPLCFRERRIWRSLLARGRPHAFFQASYFTVESDHSVWLDSTVQIARPLAHAPVTMYSQVDLGPVRRLRTGRGRDLRPHLRTTRIAGQDWWTWRLQDQDGPLLNVSQRASADAAERVGLLKPRRHAVEIHCDVSYGDDAEGAIVLELPRTLAVVRADPAPCRVVTVHGHAVLMWARCAGLAHPPVVTVR